MDTTAAGPQLAIWDSTELRHWQELSCLNHISSDGRKFSRAHLVGVVRKGSDPVVFLPCHLDASVGPIETYILLPRTRRIKLISKSSCEHSLRNLLNGVNGNGITYVMDETRGESTGSPSTEHIGKQRLLCTKFTHISCKTVRFRPMRQMTGFPWTRLRYTRRGSDDTRIWQYKLRGSDNTNRNLTIQTRI
ncbi:hypothetical protein K435DRAFT_191910 [Dendrothele bispora CBS 962.96]|uniref:Uncharacterized protein n=1 Tax=Dendrothele bispora (strain CBS 962.96) TaxID=1314807 RepID=A0A4S8LUY2_DENBC|nr:hypothetical protein K435DRAFT_191910 [Dendrothele bispora CBS 962.96]